MRIWIVASTNSTLLSVHQFIRKLGYSVCYSLANRLDTFVIFNPDVVISCDMLDGTELNCMRELSPHFDLIVVGSAPSNLILPQPGTMVELDSDFSWSSLKDVLEVFNANRQSYGGSGP